MRCFEKRRRRGVAPDGGDCRSDQVGRNPRAFSVADRGQSVWARRDPASDRAGYRGLRPVGADDRPLGAGGHPFVTDGGHWIVDAALGRIPDPKMLADRLLVVPGVVEHGLFVGLASMAILAGPGGVRTVERP